jgi:sec-independent protein translocase protein TatA
LIIILVIIVVLFGSSQIPKLARSVGKARRELKEGLEDTGDDKKKKA